VPILILDLSWIDDNSILIGNVGSTFPLASSQLLRINNLTSARVNAILIDIKLTSTFYFHGSFFSDGSHIIVFVCYLIIDWIDCWNILLWDLSSISAMSISCRGSFVQLNVIQFNLPNVWVWDSNYSFYSTFSVHIDLRMCIVVILDIHNFLVGRIHTWSSFGYVSLICQISSNTYMKVLYLSTIDSILIFDASLWISISYRV